MCCYVPLQMQSTCCFGHGISSFLVCGCSPMFWSASELHDTPCDLVFSKLLALVQFRNSCGWTEMYRPGVTRLLWCLAQNGVVIDDLMQLVYRFGITGLLAIERLYYDVDPSIQSTFYSTLVDNLEALGGCASHCRGICQVVHDDINHAMEITVGRENNEYSDLPSRSFCRLHVDPIDIATMVHSGVHDSVIRRTVRNHRHEFAIIAQLNAAIPLSIAERTSNTTFMSVWNFIDILHARGIAYTKSQSISHDELRLYLDLTAQFVSKWNCHQQFEEVLYRVSKLTGSGLRSKVSEALESPCFADALNILHS